MNEEQLEIINTVVLNLLAVNIPEHADRFSQYSKPLEIRKSLIIGIKHKDT